MLDELINDNFDTFYISYVGNTLILVKPEDIDMVLKKLNSFDKKYSVYHW